MKWKEGSKEVEWEGMKNGDHFVWHCGTDGSFFLFPSDLITCLDLVCYLIHVDVCVCVCVHLYLMMSLQTSICMALKVS